MIDYGLVSIITPCYNNSSFISQMIESVMGQTYTHWELLITDDCSSDESCKIIQSYVDSDARIKLLRLNVNSGAGVARNNSIKEASGRYIAFLDSDDMWLPNKLEEQLIFMNKNNYELVYSSYNVVDEKNRPKGIVRCLKRLSYFTLLRDNGIGCLTAIYDTDRIGKFFMPTIRKRQDWCLWLSIIKQTKYAYGLDIPLAIYRDRKGSISSTNKLGLIKYHWKVYHSIEKYSALTSFLLVFFYFMPYYFYKKYLKF